MIMDLNRTIGYICPLCSTITTRDVSVFEIPERTPVAYSCSRKNCKTDAVKIYKRKSSYTIEVMCPVCDEVHSFVLKQRLFWQDRFLRLKCPVSDVHIFFIGSEEELAIQLDKPSFLLESLMSDMDVEDELNLMFDLVSCINELAKIDAIICSCGGHNISISAEDRRIILSCRDCGAQKIIDASLGSLIVLLNTSTLVLDDTNLDQE